MLAIVPWKEYYVIVFRRYTNPMNDYVSTKEIADRWGITTRRVGKLCVTGRIPGAIKVGPVWVIPKNAAKPADARFRDNKGKQ